MEQYTVTGMSCAACSARVEKAVSKVPGVESCSVSLLTNSMGVEGSADAADIIAAVKEAVQDDASAKGLHRRIEPDDEPVGALDGQWLVKPELHKGALACTDGILI